MAGNSVAATLSTVSFFFYVMHGQVEESLALTCHGGVGFGYSARPATVRAFDIEEFDEAPCGHKPWQSVPSFGWNRTGLGHAKETIWGG
jgi:hypothetical protein